MALAIYFSALWDTRISASLSPYPKEALPCNCIHPRQLIPCAPEPGSAHSWPTPLSQIPNLADLWDVLRLWGALYSVVIDHTDVLTEADAADDYEEEHEEEYDGLNEEELFTWTVQVTFCHEDEAQDFEDNFTSFGGWDL